MDMNQYLEIFIEESKEHLQNLNQSLLALESAPGESSLLNEIFRAAHTIKGMAGTMGFSRMAKLTHDMEDVLHILRNGEMEVTTALVDLLFKCLDALESYVDAISTNGSEGNNEYLNIINSLNYVLTHKSTAPAETFSARESSSEDEAAAGWAAVLKETEDADTNFIINQYEQRAINKAIDSGLFTHKIKVFLNKGCLLKAARAYIVFQMLEKNSEVIKSIPSVEDIEDEKFDLEFTVALISKKPQEFFEKELLSISEVAGVEISSLGRKDAGEAVNDSEEQDQAKVNIKINKIHTEENNQTEDKDQEDTASKSAGNSNNRTKVGKIVRVDIERLDVLMNLVSELIITKTRMEGMEEINKDQSFHETMEYLTRITSSLHDAVMKVRMVPVETVFNKFPRMVRDVSKELGKEIILEMSGEETELDRTVIDEIGDPLMHLLRNSIDHGIEKPAERKEQSKPVEGKINLKAYQDGNTVIIEVQDDGGGINVDKVKKKAIENGLISKEIADTLSNKEIIDFLFRPSFSTADKITDISGRGVGLDVVKTKIEALGGAVEVVTEYGKGSRFIIRLPMTLAIIKTLLVKIGEEKYAIPQGVIAEIDDITPDQIKTVQNKEVILRRNKLIPIVRLNKVLDVPGTTDEMPKKATIVIVRKGEQQSGFIVDAPIGQMEIVQKPLGKALSGIKCIAGATILGDGNVALILDVNSLA